MSLYFAASMQKPDNFINHVIGNFGNKKLNKILKNLKKLVDSSRSEVKLSFQNFHNLEIDFISASDRDSTIDGTVIRFERQDLDKYAWCKEYCGIQDDASKLITIKMYQKDDQYLFSISSGEYESVEIIYNHD